MCVCLCVLFIRCSLPEANAGQIEARSGRTGGASKNQSASASPRRRFPILLASCFLLPASCFLLHASCRSVVDSSPASLLLASCCQIPSPSPSPLPCPLLFCLVHEQPHVGTRKTDEVKDARMPNTVPKGKQRIMAPWPAEMAWVESTSLPLPSSLATCVSRRENLGAQAIPAEGLVYRAG
ncbi:hypothetical protein BO70DRAFT_192754 [Aspergillus heteromorphus CBS 117.55]|uniref:Uncharacterized protein n=1 Tax=Aspergillus heteromorphus CBS 117.55 TaxID=1448321 RepID=A0A317US30_9EURO|nr:uncharacterized protein BO70DRAFT_192754 [Aspergillus heteromorphus CBS 117.55]PWY64774.1 hypothetical protein BO70DRAFT_192754 [Aspergillus heteromorphus CBS 117.55]